MSDIIECESCHMQVMGRGDQQNWKMIADDEANMHWYCRKTMCLVAYRNHYLRVLQESNPGVEHYKLIETLKQIEPNLPYPGEEVSSSAPDIPILRN